MPPVAKLAGARPHAAAIGRPFIMAAAVLLAPAWGGCTDFGSEINPLRPDAAAAIPADNLGGSPGTSGAPDAAAAPGTGGADGGRSSAVTPEAGSAADGPPGAGSPGDDAAAAEPCLPKDSFALLLTLDVTWTGTAATMGGTGKVSIWNKVDLVATGNDLSGQAIACGTVLPETPLTGLGRVAAGGGKILIEVPPAVWDAPSMPRYPLAGTRSGPALGATVQIDMNAPLGIEAPGPQTAWPDSYTGLLPLVRDADGDGHPGYLARPRPDGGYVLPPTALGLGGLAPAAEQIFLVSRNVISFKGVRASCDTLAGNAIVSAFDSHVVGCLVRGGGACTDRQTDFVDQNRMKYQPHSAVFTAQRIAAVATCDDVRRALPPQ